MQAWPLKEALGACCPTWAEKDIAAAEAKLAKVGIETVRGLAKAVKRKAWLSRQLQDVGEKSFNPATLTAFREKLAGSELPTCLEVEAWTLEDVFWSACPSWPDEDIATAISKLEKVNVASSVELAKALRRKNTLNKRLQDAGLKMFHQKTITAVREHLLTLKPPADEALMEDLLAEACPQWNPEERSGALLKLEKVGVTSIESLSKDLQGKSSLNKRLQEAGEKTFSQATLTAFRKALSNREVNKQAKAMPESAEVEEAVGTEAADFGPKQLSTAEEAEGREEAAPEPEPETKGAAEKGAAERESEAAEAEVAERALGQEGPSEETAEVEEGSQRHATEDTAEALGAHEDPSMVEVISVSSDELQPGAELHCHDTAASEAHLADSQEAAQVSDEAAVHRSEEGGDTAMEAAESSGGQGGGDGDQDKAVPQSSANSVKVSMESGAWEDLAASLEEEQDAAAGVEGPAVGREAGNAPTAGDDGLAKQDEQVDKVDSASKELKSSEGTEAEAEQPASGVCEAALEEPECEPVLPAQVLEEGEGEKGVEADAAPDKVRYAALMSKMEGRPGAFAPGTTAASDGAEGSQEPPQEDCEEVTTPAAADVEGTASRSSTGTAYLAFRAARAAPSGARSVHAAAAEVAKGFAAGVQSLKTVPDSGPTAPAVDEGGYRGAAEKPTPMPGSAHSETRPGDRQRHAEPPPMTWASARGLQQPQGAARFAFPNRTLGETKLMAAVRHCNVVLTERLLMKKVDPNEQDKFGETALMEAASRGEADLCSILLWHGADPMVRSKSGLCAMELAKEHEHLLDPFTFWREEAIRHFASLHDEDRVDSLLTSWEAGGLDFTRKDDEGGTVLHAVASRPAESRAAARIAKSLIEAKASVNATNLLGETPLILATRSCAEAEIRHSRLELPKLLMQYGANPNTSDSVLHETPLMEAACVGDADLVLLLLEAKADPLRSSVSMQMAQDFANGDEVVEILRDPKRAIEKVQEERRSIDALRQEAGLPGIPQATLDIRRSPEVSTQPSPSPVPVPEHQVPQRARPWRAQIVQTAVFERRQVQTKERSASPVPVPANAHQPALFGFAHKESNPWPADWGQRRRAWPWHGQPVPPWQAPAAPGMAHPATMAKEKAAEGEAAAPGWWQQREAFPEQPAAPEAAAAAPEAPPPQPPPTQEEWPWEEPKEEEPPPTPEEKPAARKPREASRARSRPAKQARVHHPPPEPEEPEEPRQPTWQERIEEIYEQYPGFASAGLEVPPEAIWQNWEARELELYCGSMGQLWPHTRKRMGTMASARAARMAREYDKQVRGEQHSPPRSRKESPPKPPPKTKQKEGLSRPPISFIKRHLKVLDLPEDKEPIMLDLKRAYRMQALKLHPDKNAGRETEAAAQFQTAVASYEFLMQNLGFNNR